MIVKQSYICSLNLALLIMKKIGSFCLFSVLSIMLFSCQGKIYQLNEEFTLDFNKSASITIDGTAYAIKFTELIEDSRCPENVECFWAGRVIVNMEVNESDQFALGLQSATIPSSANFKNHLIHLLQVRYGKAKNQGKAKHYSIQLRVE